MDRMIDSISHIRFKYCFIFYFVISLMSVRKSSLCQLGMRKLSSSNRCEQDIKPHELGVSLYISVELGKSWKGIVRIKEWYYMNLFTTCVNVLSDCSVPSKLLTFSKFFVVIYCVLRMYSNMREINWGNCRRHARQSIDALLDLTTFCKCSLVDVLWVL